MAAAPQKRVWLSIDLSLAAQRRISKAAAQGDLSVRQYVLEAVQQRLKKDLSEEIERERPLVLSLVFYQFKQLTGAATLWFL